MNLKDNSWSPDSWRSCSTSMQFDYGDTADLQQTSQRLSRLPPLVTSWEIESLKSALCDAEAGKRFVLQGGDCAETLQDCRPQVITNKLKILIQMSLVLIHGMKKPVLRIGRLAGQYAKPRSQADETAGGVTLPSYFGDLINGSDFTEESRTPRAGHMLAGYMHAALTLNFVRSLTAAGFADVHHAEQWDLTFTKRADLSPELRDAYEATRKALSDSLHFMEVLGERPLADLTRVEFYTSHEGLNLHYETAQTRAVPRRPGFYNLTTHLPWIGERTRRLDGAHVEFFRGIENPVGVKIGPKVTVEDLLALGAALNPQNKPGKIVWITRMGARETAKLPVLLTRAKAEGLAGLWMCDPMHGNTHLASGGKKTRNCDEILSEIRQTHEAHRAVGTRLGGLHLELTGEDVTECTGGGLRDEDLDRNYETSCDPRLNYRQALEMSFSVARLFAEDSREKPVAR
jgi:3-deoxy-7-phosphoheptulonate synthase